MPMQDNVSPSVPRTRPHADALPASIRSTPGEDGGREHHKELRFLTYLSPGLPLELFEEIVERAGRTLGMEVSLAAETGLSGPQRGPGDPFSNREADVGFVCAPALFWMRDQGVPPVELAGAAPVFRDRRAPGQPVYFSEVVVRHDSPCGGFWALRGGTWAYNDPCSLSGYHCMLKKLAGKEGSAGFFEDVRYSGSHFESMRMVAAGEADAAAIDSNVLRISSTTMPDLRAKLRIVESWGPFPVQPVVVRSGLPVDLKARLRDALLAMPRSPVLSRHGLEGFTSVSYRDYAAEEQALRECEEALSGSGLVTGMQTG